MQIKRLFLSNFRNLTEQTLEFNSRVTVFLGKNGQGKTSILEAISLLSHSRSFRTAKLRELIQYREAQSPTQTIVRAEASDVEGDIELSYQIEADGREVFLNGKKITSAGSFFGRVKTIEFTPKDLALIQEGPQERRRLFDRTLSVIDRSYLTNVVLYQRALKNRNQLLLQIAKESRGNFGSFGPQLAAWEQLLIEHGRAIAERRNRFVLFLNNSLDPTYQSLIQAHEPLEFEERIRAQYASAFFAEGELSTMEQLTRKYENARMNDVRLRSTSVGVHRDDLQLHLNCRGLVRPAREFASQGQCRTIALALKMAAARYIAEESNEDPIVLLDDVESELDSSRRFGLANFVRDCKSQVILTTTDISMIASEVRNVAQTFVLRGGQAYPQN